MLERSVEPVDRDIRLKLQRASDCTIVVTEDLLIAAASNSYIILEYLLAKDPNIPITGQLPKAAATSPGGKACLELLGLGEHYIGQDILLAAAGGPNVMEFTLDRNSSIPITEEAPLAGANHCESLSYLLSRLGQIEVTDSLIMTVVAKADRNVVKSLSGSAYRKCST